MSEAKHTPGPWEWSEDSPDAVLRGGDRDVVLRPNYGICVGDIYGIIMAKKEDKDLIAAAPDMLDALEFCCVNNCERRLWYKQNRTTPPFDMPKEKCTDCPVYQAIQKAKGELQ